MKQAIATKPGLLAGTLSRIWLYMVVSLAGTSVGAQGWEISSGGIREDQGIAILQTVDQGYLQVGFSESFGSDGDIDIYAVRTDIDGVTVWERTYDPGFIEQPGDVVAWDNRGFVIAGSSEATPGASTKVFLLAVSNNGNVVWYREYDNNGLNQRGNKLARTSDGGFILIGSSENTADAEEDVLLIKVDAEGLEEWRETYDNGRDDVGVGITPVMNGYVFAVNTKNNQGIGNIALYRVDLNGELLAIKVYGAGNNDTEKISDLLLTQDGNILVVGSVDNDNKGFIAKADLNGDTLWTREIDASLFDDVLQSVIEEEDGSIVAVGLTAPTASQILALLVKVDTAGNLIWSRKLGFQNYVYIGVDLAPAARGGYIIGGYNTLDALVFFNDMIFIRVDGEGNYYSNQLSGKVFWTQDGCNPIQPTDLGLGGWLVTARSSDLTFVGTTDEEGNYALLVDTGLYTVTLTAPNPAWEVCNPVAYIAEFTEFYDTTVYNFPARAAQNCPFLEVGVSVAPVVACSMAEYSVQYCNWGTATAQDAYLELTLDDELTFVSASIDPTLVESNFLVIPLGDLQPYQCGTLTVQTEVACNGWTAGQAVLVMAHIYPDTLCLPVDPNWDGADIQVTGTCENDTLRFQIRNDGAAMQEAKRFVIVEDQVLFRTGNFNLDPMEAEDIEVPATGATYRLIAEQPDGHPASTFRTIALEGCPAPGSNEYQTGQLAQFPESDQEPTIDIDVQQLISSSESLTMSVNPKGYQGEVITPDTDLEYTVFFKNTGTDTVTRVVIRDTLPAALDLSTLQLGPASHPYEFALYGEGILKITFEGIQLTPDGGVGEASSRGFIKFRLSQKPNNPLGTQIDNYAAVFFDYVEPGVTNAVTQVVGCADFLSPGCILVAVDPEPQPTHGYHIRVYPNPFFDQATFEVEGCTQCQNLELRIYDVLGKLVRTEVHQGPRFEFQRRGLAPAMYMYELRAEGQAISTGRFFVQ